MGCLVSAVLAFFGGRVGGVFGPFILLSMSALVFWVALFLGLEVGYRAWQSGPDAPPQAFSDTAPMGALVAGWAPGSVFACFWFGISRLIRAFIWKSKVDGFAVSDCGSNLLSGAVVETRNAYQPPTDCK